MDASGHYEGNKEYDSRFVNDIFYSFFFISTMGTYWRPRNDKATRKDSIIVGGVMDKKLYDLGLTTTNSMKLETNPLQIC